MTDKNEQIPLVTAMLPTREQATQRFALNIGIPTNFARICGIETKIVECSTLEKKEVACYYRTQSFAEVETYNNQNFVITPETRSAVGYSPFNKQIGLRPLLFVTNAEKLLKQYAYSNDAIKYGFYLHDFADDEIAQKAEFLYTHKKDAFVPTNKYYTIPKGPFLHKGDFTTTNSDVYCLDGQRLCRTIAYPHEDSEQLACQKFIPNNAPVWIEEQPITWHRYEIRPQDFTPEMQTLPSNLKDKIMKEGCLLLSDYILLAGLPLQTVAEFDERKLSIITLNKFLNNCFLRDIQQTPDNSRNYEIEHITLNHGLQIAGSANFSITPGNAPGSNLTVVNHADMPNNVLITIGNDHGRV